MADGVLEQAARERAATRAALQARLEVTLHAVAAVIVPRADREVLAAAAAMVGDERLRPEQLLVFVEPRRAQLSAALADVNAERAEAEARELVTRPKSDAGQRALDLAAATRLEALARRRREAEDGLRNLDIEVVIWARTALVRRFADQLEADPAAFEAVAAQLPRSARPVVRAARIVGAGLRYLEALYARRVSPLQAQALQREVMAQAGVPLAAPAPDTSKVQAFLQACAAVSAFHSYDEVVDDELLWDRLLGPCKQALQEDADGSFCDEVRVARVRAEHAENTTVDPRLEQTAVVERPVRSLPPQHDESRLGCYRLLQRLGAGGMAEVWLAQKDGPRGFTKDVVVKRILAQHAGDPFFIDLFHKEASLIARLMHPHLVHVFDLGVEGDRWYMVMELLRGLSVLDLVKGDGGPIGVDVVARVIADAASGLAYAHAQQVIHRDISPDNLFVTDPGLTKVLDFGVAIAGVEVTSSKELAGKIPFMAPERLEGAPYDAAVDVFALGVTLYWMLVGKRPWTGPLPVLMRAIVQQEPAAPSSLRDGVPPAMNDLVMKMLAKKPQSRPRAAAVEETLSRLAAPAHAVGLLTRGAARVPSP